MDRINFCPELSDLVFKRLKRETRRIIKPQPTFYRDRMKWHHEKRNWTVDGERERAMAALEHFSPHRVGDVLAVNERFALPVEFDDMPPSDVPQFYNGAPTQVWFVPPRQVPDDPRRGRWRHGNFMPTWCARSKIEIRDVRIERLHDMSSLSLRREGFMERRHFVALWNQLNGEGSYEQNPYVWVFRFRRLVEKARAAA